MGSFFAAAIRAGERAPSETIERYAFLRVHRARTPVHGARKAEFFIEFDTALVLRGENDALWAFVRWAQHALSSNFEYLKEK